jgi:hypothetical protein
MQSDFYVIQKDPPNSATILFLLILMIVATIIPIAVNLWWWVLDIQARIKSEVPKYVQTTP